MTDIKRSSRKRGTGLLGLALAAVMAFSALSAASASAVTIAPLGTNIEIGTNHVEFSFGSTAITCSGFGGTGTISAAASSEAKLGDLKAASWCPAVGMGGVVFKVLSNSSATNPFALKANSLTTGALRLPGANENGKGLELISGLCKLATKADYPSGAWTNGEDKAPIAKPATLAINKATVNLQNPLYPQNEEYCPAALVSDLKKSPSLKLTATFSVTNTSFPSLAVRFK